MLLKYITFTRKKYLDFFGNGIQDTLKGLLRNSKTHALHKNESRTSVEILSLFIFKRTHSGHS